jgi:hypothetical protein
MVGSTVTVEFADGTTRTVEPFAGDSPGEATGDADADDPAAPTLGVEGVSLSATELSPAHTAATVPDADRTVTVSGPADATVRLLVVRAGLYTDGVPGGGYDLDDYEANKALSRTVETVTLGSDGTATVDLTLSRAGEAGDLTYLVAGVVDGDEVGPLSNKVVLEYDPDGGPAPTPNSPPEADAGTDRSVTAGDGVTLDASGSSDPDGDDGALAYSWSQSSGPEVSLDGASTPTATFTAPDVGSATTLAFAVTVTDPEGASDTDEVTVTVSPDGSTGSPSFSVSGLDAPAAVSPGASATVSATVSNDGDAPGTAVAEVRLDADGDGSLEPDEALSSNTVSLDPGSSSPVAFSVDVPGDLDSGTYAVGVFAGGASATGTVDVVGDDPPGPSGPVDVRVRPDEASIDPGSETTLAVEVVDADGGVGSYAGVVSVGNASVARLTGVRVPGVPADQVSTSVAPDGSSIQFSTDALDSASRRVTVAEVTVEAVDLGRPASTAVSVGTQRVTATDGTEYDVGSATGADLTVSETELGASFPSVSPGTVVRGDAATFSASVSNPGETVASGTVELRLDLDGDGRLDPDEAVATERVTVDAGGSTSVTFSRVRVPADAPLGRVAFGVFTGDAVARGSVTTTLPAVADGMGPPRDVDGDGALEDVNGDGSLSLSDVTALFAQREAAVVAEHPSMFDFNGNGAFTLADVTALFVEAVESRGGG